MQITGNLTQNEIETAIRNYLSGSVQLQEDQRMDIEFKSTRGPDGITAKIAVVDKDAPLPVKKTYVKKAPTVSADGTATAPKKRGRKSNAEKAAEAAALAAEQGEAHTETQPVPEAQPAQEPAEAPVEATPAGEAVATTEAEAVPQEAPNNGAVAQAEAEPVTTADTEATIEAELPVAQEEVRPLAEIENKEEAPTEAPSTDAAPRASLFGNLKRPNNSENADGNDASA